MSSGSFRTVQVMMLKRHKNPRLMQKIRKCLLQLKRILRRKMKTKMFCCGASISCASALTCTDQFFFLGLFQAAVSQTHQRRTWILLQGRRNCFLKFMSFFISRLISFRALFIDLNIYHLGSPFINLNLAFLYVIFCFFICWDF